MKEDSGKPALGPRDLGVRTPPDEQPDIVPDTAGFVSPDTGGMSVSPALLLLPDTRIPKRLRQIYPFARGSNSLVIWSSGNGPFEDSVVAANLTLRLYSKNPTKHGFVEPDQVMPYKEYANSLIATRDA
jgi:hypothetical protein